MAEGFLFNTIEKLIGKLGSLVVEAWKGRDDVEKLVESMSEIKTVLLDADEQQKEATNTNHEVQLWLEKLKHSLDDADDLLDEFSFEDLRRQVMTKEKKVTKVRIFFSPSNKIVFSFKMARKIKDLRNRFEGLNIHGRVFHFNDRTPRQRHAVKQRETHSFIREGEIIGREDEKKDLLEMLLNTDIDEKENISVISIVGIGGLGKTALAQLVYNDKAVQQHFELKNWVCVADDDSNAEGFDVKGIAAKIRVQLTLLKKVGEMRYLLVLDDVWNQDREQWLQLMTMLKDGAKGSKIIITTRSKKVAKICGTSSHLFLKGLDEEGSWNFLSKLAFQDGREPEFGVHWQGNCQKMLGGSLGY